MTTGQRMKARRKQVGISADTLAEKLGVSRSTIFRYENGDIEKMPIDIIKPIADALDTTVDYLMGWDDHPTPTNENTPAQSEGISGAYLNMAKHAQDSGVAPEDICQMIDIMKKNEAKKNDKG